MNRKRRRGVMGQKKKSKKALEAEVVELQRRIAELEARLQQEGSPSGKVLENPVEVTRLMLEYANDAIYIFQDGFLKYVNAKTIEITGYSAEDFLTKPGMDLVHPEDRPVIYERYLRRTRGDEVPNLYPYRIFDKQGRIHWLEVSSVMMTWEGRPAQLSFMRDITEKKAAEEALRRSERLRTDIINFLPDATFAIDRQGCVTAWNRAMEALTGVASQDMIGKGNGEYALAFYGKREPILIDKVLDPSLPMTGRILSFQSGDDFLLAEKEFLLNGQPIILWCKAGVMKDDRGQVIGAIESLRDITALKETNVALNILLKKRENDIRESEEKLMLNIKELVLPYVMKLKDAHLDLSHTVHIDIIEKHLNEIMSPFLSKLNSQFSQLSPRELQVASLIRNDMTTKEIAAALNVSTNAIDIYRQNIRKKLGINKEKINLRSFLVTLGTN